MSKWTLQLVSGNTTYIVSNGTSNFNIWFQVHSCCVKSKHCIWKAFRSTGIINGLFNLSSVIQIIKGIIFISWSRRGLHKWQLAATENIMQVFRKRWRSLHQCNGMQWKKQHCPEISECNLNFCIMAQLQDVLYHESCSQQHLKMSLSKYCDVNIFEIEIKQAGTHFLTKTAISCSLKFICSSN